MSPHTHPDDAVILDNPSTETYEQDVDIPEIPEGAVEKGEAFELDCSITLKPSSEFEAWAKDNGVTFRFGFEEVENFVQVELGNQGQADLFLARWKTPEPA